MSSEPTFRRKEEKREGWAFRAVVSGRVQGVGFRYATARRAHGLRIYGWVRNLANSTVEIHAEGREEKTRREFLRWLKFGPSGAVVDTLEVKEVPYMGTFTTFSVSF